MARASTSSPTGCWPEGASPGTCESSVAHGSLTNLKGHCNLYLWHEGEIAFIVRLNAELPFESSDTFDWVPSARVSSGYAGRTARLADEGKALLFRSRDALSEYENEGVPELYLYREGHSIACVSCNPSGEAPEKGPLLGRIGFTAGLPPGLGPMATMTRNLSSNGDRVFFETAESLTPADTNGTGGHARNADSYPSCEDVYEWEAQDSGQCKAASPSYSPLTAAACI